MTLLHVDSIILWSRQVDETVAFYRKIGLPIVTESHSLDDPPHYALDFGEVHFGFIEATPGVALNRGVGGAVQFGFRVESVDITYRLAIENGAISIISPEDMPWGRRAVVEDPDGRPIQFKQMMRTSCA